jgi:hypothetical protein
MSRHLRIFLCCQQATRRHAVPAYSFWADYFRRGLPEAGHTLVEAPACDWAEGLTPLDETALATWREKTWQTAMDFLRVEHAREPIHLFLAYLFPRQVLPAAVEEIRQLGIPVVNFFCDNVRELRTVPPEFRCFDLHWVPEFKARPMYRDAGLAFVPCPMPCWVPPVHRSPPTQETRPVTFVGTRDEQREVLFQDAIRLGLQVELRGVGWLGATTAPPPPPPARNPLARIGRQFDFARQHGWPALARKLFLPSRPPLDFDFSNWARPLVADEEYWPTLREARVCLGVNRYPSLRHPFRRPDTYSRLRDIEAPMAGACYLTEWTEGLDELYEPGVEIEVYRDAAELADKAGALAADAGRRQTLRRQGQRRALSDHSIGRSLERIAGQLGLNS